MVETELIDALSECSETLRGCAHILLALAGQGTDLDESLSLTAKNLFEAM